jgi:hypothetical protein
VLSSVLLLLLVVFTVAAEILAARRSGMALVLVPTLHEEFNAAFSEVDIPRFDATENEEDELTPNRPVEKDEEAVAEEDVAP